MSAAGGLSAYLRGLTQRRRDEVAACNGIVAGLDVRALADRLARPAATLTALRGLDAFALDLLEGLLAVTDGVASGADVDALVDGRATRAQVAAAVDRLAQAALAWPLGAAVCPARRVLQVLPMPAGLGRPAAELLATTSVAVLETVVRSAGLAPAGRKPALVQQVAALLQDGRYVATALDSAPPEAAELLAALAGSRSGIPLWAPPRPGEPLRWLLDRGLAVHDAGRFVVELPREVALALRGGRVLAELTPVPPGHPVGVGAAATDPGAGAGEIGHLLADARAVLQALEARVVPALKSGGLGVRELRKLATTLAIGEERARFVVELLAAAGLLDAGAGGEVLPTDDADEWQVQPPHLQWLVLLAAWLSAPAPLLVPGGGAVAVPGGREQQPVQPGLLAAVLGGLPPGTTAAPADLAGRARWLFPLSVPPAQALPELPQLLGELLTESASMGLTVAGALTPAARLVYEGDQTGMELIAPHLPQPSGDALVGSDLTVVVAGPPAPALARLLDTIGTRESRGAGATWRLSPASVRSAFDDGREALAILDGLRSAAGRELPATVTQLVADVARRHGEVSVGVAGSVLATGDPSLAARLAADRQLAGLRLRDLGGGVLSAPGAPDVVLARLRAAGYFPRAEEPAPRTRARRAPVAAGRRRLVSGVRGGGRRMRLFGVPGDRGGPDGAGLDGGAGDGVWLDGIDGLEGPGWPGGAGALTPEVRDVWRRCEPFAPRARK